MALDPSMPVLVVDDYTTMVRIIRNLLRQLGFADVDDALAFYRRFYTPNNAIVVVAGDVDPSEVKADAEETYGKVAPRAEIAPRRRPQEPPQEAPRTVTLADARVEQPSVSRYYLVPSRTTAKTGESQALEVLAHVLGSGVNSRLYRALVVEQSVALNAGAYYSGTALDYGKFGVDVYKRQSQRSRRECPHH